MKRLSFLMLLILTFTGKSLMAGNKDPHVLIETTLGTIEVELYAAKAPLTVNNFLRYIKENRWKGAAFYRTVTMQNQPHNKVKIEVIQGGLGDDTTQMLPPIKIETTKETGIHHLNGTISMARDKPNSATSEFFICIGKQPSLDFGGKRNPDGQGFTAFGRVVKGMKIVREIQQQPAKGQMLTPPVKILRIRLKK
ncbi:MAG: peptidylprolyl isomerase [Bacteroidales bacterium]|nr:peptidylprolyl isomerase [Bacteroidales bacterium]